MSPSVNSRSTGCTDQRYRYANLAWELFYWIVLASTSFERIGYGAWFATDLIYVTVTVRYEYADQIWQATWRICRGVCVFVLGFWIFSFFYHDHQSSAFWTGLVMQVCISWGSLYNIARREDMKGHSLEIWFVNPCTSHVYGTGRLIKVTGALGV